MSVDATPGSSSPVGSTSVSMGPAPGAEGAFLSGRSTRLGDVMFHGLSLFLGMSIILLAASLLVSMIVQSEQSIGAFGLSFVWTSTWNPVTGVFGALPAIYGTIASSTLGLLLAIPAGLGAAIFLAELAPNWLSRPLSMMIELLAAIPSVIIGFWGLFVLVPLIDPVQVFLGQILGFLPLFAGPSLGIGMFSAGVVLAVMILPILTAVIRDVIIAVPRNQREAMLALGATEWETIARAVLPYGQSGIVGAIILALGRALGETMAVTMVIGNTYKIDSSLFAPATTLASLIAAQFREADSELYTSSLIEAGIVLFVITVLVNVVARLLVWRVAKRPVGMVGGG